jgi:hypothetical protein
MGRGKRSARGAVATARPSPPLRAVRAGASQEPSEDLLLEAGRQVVTGLNKKPLEAGNAKTLATKVEQLLRLVLEQWVGTYVETERGNWGQADLPALGYDLKITSLAQPQSSAVYKHPSEKIFGLSYGILLLPYSVEAGRLRFAEPVVIPREQTGDRHLTTELLMLKAGGASRREVSLYLRGAEPGLTAAELDELAGRVVTEDFPVGRLRLTDVRQWRVRYAEAIREARAATGCVHEKPKAKAKPRRARPRNASTKQPRDQRRLKGEGHA